MRSRNDYWNKVGAATVTGGLMGFVMKRNPRSAVAYAAGLGVASLAYRVR